MDEYSGKKATVVRECFVCVFGEYLSAHAALDQPCYDIILTTDLSRSFIA